MLKIQTVAIVAATQPTALSNISCSSCWPVRLVLSWKVSHIYASVKLHLTSIRRCLTRDVHVLEVCDRAFMLPNSYSTCISRGTCPPAPMTWTKNCFRSVYQINMKFDRQLRPATETSQVVSYGGKTIPRWRTAVILKIDISPYLSEKSSDFDEILYTAADVELAVLKV